MNRSVIKIAIYIKIPNGILGVLMVILNRFRNNVTLEINVKKKKSKLGIAGYLSCLIGNNPFVSKITLVSNQEFVHTITSITINFIQPLLNIVKAFLVCHIKNHLQKQVNRSSFHRII